MSLLNNSSIDITLLNTDIDPHIRQYKIIKDINNILQIPSDISLWLKSDPSCKDYTNQYKLFTENNTYSIELIISIIREDRIVIVDLIYNKEHIIDKGIAFNFKVIPDTYSVNLFCKRIVYVIDIILGYNSPDLLHNAKNWFVTDIK